jgi:hypothetical protein
MKFDSFLFRIFIVIGMAIWILTIPLNIPMVVSILISILGSSILTYFAVSIFGNKSVMRHGKKVKSFGFEDLLKETRSGKPKKATLQENPNPKSSCAVCGSSLPNLHMYQTSFVVGGSWGYCENCEKLFCKNHSKQVDVCYYEGKVEYTESHCPDCDHLLKTPSVIWQKSLG